MKKLLLTIFIFLCCSQVYSQSSFTGFDATGYVNFSTNLYSTDLGPKRFDNGFTQLIGGITLKNDFVELPFQFYVSNRKREFQQPFNQIGITPKFFGWLKVNAGYFSTKISDFTYGDSRMLGLGVETFDTRYRFGFNWGRIQQEIDPDTTRNFYGKFSRYAWMLKLGYGLYDKAYVDFNLFKAYDNVNSLQKVLYPNTPKENVVTSFSFVLPYVEQDLNCYGELSTSLYTSDTREADYTTAGFYNILKPLFAIKYSTRYDGAALLGIDYTLMKKYKFGFESRWIGPGFITLGYEYLQNDLFDNKLTTELRFLDNNLFVKGNFGFRVNNLRNNKVATTNRLIGSIFASYQASNSFGFDVNFMNYGMKSDPANDSLRIDNISNFISLSPRFNFNALNATTNLMFNYSYQNLENLNIISYNRNKVRSHSILGNWNLVYPSGFNVGTSINYMDTRINDIDNKFTNFTLYLNKGFFNNSFFASVNLGYYIMSSLNTNNQFNGNVNLSYSFSEYGRVSVYVLRNVYNTDFNPTISEWLANIQYSYNF